MSEKRLRDKLDKDTFNNKVVLDIGTGVSSIKYLLGCDPSKIIAVTINEDEIKEIKEELGDISKIQFIVSDANELTINERVDVVFSGYFYSALRGTRHDSLLTVTEKLYDLLEDGGEIIIEDFYWSKELPEEQDRLAKRLWDITYEVKDIIKKSYPIQMPENDIISLLKKSGFRNIKVETENLNRGKEKEKIARYKKQLESIRKHANKIGNQAITERYIQEAECIYKELENIGKAAFFSYDYIVSAAK